ncbi:hypothetical protein GCM10022222_72040 [Amycolatopsis ultiminotia]|uniref:Uncharacterized protein n=1 Tax=Amycolatopsis ultiminotia TaxID=543629 RepID=A0ABP6Y3U9_9PSEU
MNEVWYRVLEIAVATVGIRAGIAPILSRLFGDGNPSWLAFVNYLGQPWCYLAAVGVLVVSVVAVVVLEGMRKKSLSNSDS